MSTEDFKPKTTFEQLPPKIFKVDPRVQRALSEARVVKIAQGYNHNLMKPRHASKRDDGYYILDGQHSNEVAIRKGYGDVPVLCEVYHELILAEEARLFHVLNDQTPIPKIKDFDILVQAGDVDASLLNGVLQSHGWVVISTQRKNRFAAIMTLYRVYDLAAGEPARRAEFVDRVIGSLTLAWGHNAQGVRSELVEGVGRFLHRYASEVKDDRLVKRLTEEFPNPFQIYSNARNASYSLGQSIVDGVITALINMYNKGLRGPRLAPWGSSSPTPSSRHLEAI